MSSMENMGGMPEQPEEESVENEGGMEHHETSHREAAEITRQRRLDYGLGESGDLTPEQAREVDAAIEGLLDRLSEHDYDKLSLEKQEEWYWIEKEADMGKDRELAKAVLERFLGSLESES